MNGDSIMSMIRRSQGCGMAAVAAGAAAAAMLVSAMAAAEPSAPRRIGYVMTDEHWALYETPGAKQECPKGFNLGPREQFKVLFPDNGKQRSVVDTQLAREAAVWFPSTTKEPFEFLEAQGPIALGVNLDGKVGPSD